MAAADRYTIITSDSHAGGSHAQYREYLEEQYLDDFDAWRGQYRNPWKDLKDDRRARNWDSGVRWEQQQNDGVVGEVLFPNTVPPFFPNFVLFAAPPTAEEYEHRLAGVRAHNRWLVDFVAESPERRAGIGQIFLNDLDDAIADATWIKGHGLRGGVLLPNVAPDVKWVRPLYDAYYDPLWRHLEELEVPVHVHGGTGVPNYGDYPISMLLYINEVGFYAQRPFVHMVLGGVFERFPKLKFVMTETGCAWVPPLLAQLDEMIVKIRDTGATGEIRYPPEAKRELTATECFRQNCWMGVSQPGPDDVAARYEIGLDRFMWGNDYPHDEGTYPFTREHLRQLFHDVPEAEMRAMLAGNAADLFGFDLVELERLGNAWGPTVGELAEPLTELPEHPNEVLVRGAALAAI